MAKRTDFYDILDELNWTAFYMSDGNFEAASQFVKKRNKEREKEKGKEK